MLRAPRSLAESTMVGGGSVVGSPSGVTADGPLVVRMVRSEEAWDALRADWDEIYAASLTASTPLAFRWLRHWWTVYGRARRDARLEIITVWRGARLLGVLPLYRRRGRLGVRCLGFLSTGEPEVEETCPDYLDMLCRVGEEAACSAACWRAIAALEFDQLELLDMPQGPFVQSSAAPPGHERSSRGACLVADLEGGFEAYLKRLSANSRQNARRLLREGERAGVALELADEARAPAVFAELMQLHQVRWLAEGKPGVFAAERFVAFHRRLLGDWLPTGQIVLARMAIAGQPLAILYGFVTRGRFEFYQSGVQVGDDGPLRSPGALAHLMLMRALVDRGVTAYDFLRGQASYKARLTTGQTELVAITMWRPTARAAVYRSARWGRRALRAGWTRVRPPRAERPPR